MRELKLINGINAGIKRNENTPRIALTADFLIPEAPKYAGLYVLASALLYKGTKKYSSEELATILDENAIDLRIEMKVDYLRISLVCLNEDFEFALSILSDIILNSTFEEFEKEKIKLKGEMIASLDSARVKIADLFAKTLYRDHFYGNVCSRILEDIDNITIEDVKTEYKNILEKSKKVVAVVGDIDYSEAENLLNKYFADVPMLESPVCNLQPPQKTPQQYAELIKEDAQQAQIIQGWHVPQLTSDDYPRLMLLNIILGASGLSSRLFTELREKKGLAYTVRTAYESKLLSAIFSIYIGTEPGNIETSIEGFKIEIDKIKQELISEEELENAKNNLIGKQHFITETNSQQANLMAYYAISDLPFNYQSHLIELLLKVTAEELRDCAQRLFTDDFTLTVLKP